MPGDKREPKLYRGKFYAVDYACGKRRRRSLGTSDRVEADKRLLLLDELEKRQAASGNWDVARIWAAYQQDLGDRPSAATVAHLGKAVLPFFGNHLPAQIDKAACQAYIEQRRAAGRRDGAIWTELSRLSSALRWAWKCKLIDSAPFIWRPRMPKPRHDYLEREEVNRLLTALHAPHLKLFVRLAVTTAGRASAIFELTWDRVDFARGVIHLEDPDTVGETIGKGRATVPMNQTIRAALREAQRGAQSKYVIEWGGRPVRKIGQSLANAAKRAGLKHVHPHMLRHTAAVWLAAARVPMSEIAQYLGHSDSRVTERIYARYAPHHLVSAAGALEIGIYEVEEPGPDEPKLRVARS